MTSCHLRKPPFGSRGPQLSRRGSLRPASSLPANATTIVDPSDAQVSELLRPLAATNNLNGLHEADVRGNTWINGTRKRRVDASARVLGELQSHSPEGTSSASACPAPVGHANPEPDFMPSKTHASSTNMSEAVEFCGLSVKGEGVAQGPASEGVGFSQPSAPHPSQSIDDVSTKRGECSATESYAESQGKACSDEPRVPCRLINLYLERHPDSETVNTIPSTSAPMSSPSSAHRGGRRSRGRGGSNSCSGVSNRSGSSYSRTTTTSRKGVWDVGASASSSVSSAQAGRAPSTLPPSPRSMLSTHGQDEEPSSEDHVPELDLKSQQRSLTRVISSASSYEELAELLEQPEALNPIHVAAMFACLVRLNSSPMEQWGPIHSSGSRHFVRELLVLAEEQLPYMGLWEVVTVMEAIVKLQCVPRKTYLIKLMEQAARRMKRGGEEDVTALGLVRIIWSVGKLGLRAPRAAWATKFYQAVELRWSDFSPQGLVMVLHAIAHMRMDPPQAWMAKLLSQIQDKVAQCSSQDLSLALWSVGRLRYPVPPGWTNSLLSVSHLQLNCFSYMELSNMLWGLSRLKHRPPEHWVDAFFVASTPREQQRPSCQGMSIIMLSSANLDIRPPSEWLNLTLVCAALNFKGFNVQGLACMVFALASIGFNPGANWLDAFHAHLKTRADTEFAQLSVDRLEWAYNVLAYEAPLRGINRVPGISGVPLPKDYSMGDHGGKFKVAHGVSETAHIPQGEADCGDQFSTRGSLDGRRSSSTYSNANGLNGSGQPQAETKSAHVRSQHSCEGVALEMQASDASSDIRGVGQPPRPA